MGSERQCGLGSLLPMSCRGRAEAFARRLHTRLRRLGAEPGGSAHEATWLTGPPPPHHPDSDVFFDFDVELESPSSPADEIPEANISNLVISNNHRSDPESGCVFSSPADNESPPSNSDSDATYYDLENDPDQSHQSKISNYLKYHKVYEDGHIAKNLSKLKLSTPASEIIDHLLQNKSISPDRQSPIRTQPLARENGFADYGSLEKRDSSNSLYSPIKFDDCQRRNSNENPIESVDEVDHMPPPAETICNGRMSPETPEKLDESSEECLPNSLNEYDKSDSIVDAIEDNIEDNSIETDLTECAIKDETNENACEEDSTEKIYDESSEDNCSENIEYENIEVNGTEPLIEVTSHVTEEEEKSQDDIETEDRPQRVRRCSSLRTGKTPPGTPGRKKIVRFADVLGLDLADVKTFMDDIPNIPKSAFEDLRDADFHSSSTESFIVPEIPRTFEKRLIPLFQQPGDQPNFLDILNARSACLENAVVQEGATLAIYGTVRVRNLDFHKSVQIRYSLDSWKSFSDLQATYVPNSCDGFSDRFQFLLYAHTLIAGQKLEFAVRFMCKGCQYWDNNLGSNYVFQCISSGNNHHTTYFHHPTNMSMSPINSWNASFY